MRKSPITEDSVTGLFLYSAPVTYGKGVHIIIVDTLVSNSSNKSLDKEIIYDKIGGK